MIESSDSGFDITSQIKESTQSTVQAASIPVKQDSVEELIEKARTSILEEVRAEIKSLEERLTEKIHNERIKRRWLKGIVYENICSYKLLRQLVVQTSGAKK